VERRDWTAEEVSLILADHFDMLRLDLAGREFVKAERNRALQERPDGRNRISIEFRHQNISTVPFFPLSSFFLRFSNPRCHGGPVPVRIAAGGRGDRPAGDTMPSDESKQFMFEIALRSSGEKESNPSWRESLGTHMLGVLSVGLGLAVVMQIPLIWFGFYCVTQEIEVRIEFDPPPESLAVALPKPDTSFAPYCGIAIVGQFLGMAGVWLGMRTKSTISPLSMMGIGLCLIAVLPMYLMLIVSVLVIVLPFLLPVLAIMAIHEVIKKKWG
jgi:hypothetical protein